MSTIDNQILETVDSICVEVSPDFPLVAFLAGEVSEVILTDKSQLHPIPRSEDTFLGLILLRDKTIPVIDLLKSISSLEPKKNSSLKLRLLIVNYNKLQIAFQIDSVIGYVPIHPVKNKVASKKKGKKSDKLPKSMKSSDSEMKKVESENPNFFKGNYSSSNGIIDSDRQIILLNLEEFLNIEYRGSTSETIENRSTSENGSSKIVNQDQTAELEDDALDFSQYTLPEED